MEFNSVNNKGLLWNVLQKNNVFKDLNNTDFTYIQEAFEHHISCLVDDSSFQSLSFMEKNKTFVLQFRDFLSNYRNNKTIKNKERYTSPILNKTLNIDKHSEDSFVQRVREKEEEFNLLMGDKKPSPIDFSDKGDSEQDTNKEEVNEIVRNYDDYKTTTSDTLPSQTQTNRQEQDIISLITSMQKQIKEQGAHIELLQTQMKELQSHPDSTSTIQQGPSVSK
jgi:hypothetical protein